MTRRIVASAHCFECDIQPVAEYGDSCAWCIELAQEYTTCSGCLRDNVPYGTGWYCHECLTGLAGLEENPQLPGVNLCRNCLHNPAVLGNRCADCDYYLSSSWNPSNSGYKAYQPPPEHPIPATSEELEYLPARRSTNGVRP